MTDHKDSNVPHDDSTARSQKGSPAGGPPHGDGDDAAWREFLEAHGDELSSVERSRAARRFERHAEKREKEALLDVKDLAPDAFASSGAGAGPRDFTGRSWLDVDDTMDQGSDFVPPNPRIGPVRTSRLVLWAMTAIGVLALVGCVLLPAWSTTLGTVGGAFTILGAAGLLALHKGHTQTRTDEFDDGARV